ncbi:MAG: sigma 54-interacting transcriptional regulator [Candidatus Alcyoniella australis]|nr:sigma 54-interacting transcriptional regulator [Candidatus Alcyoniella australis]
MSIRVTVCNGNDVVCSLTNLGVLSIGTEQHNDLVLPPPSPDDPRDFRLVFIRRGPQLFLQAQGSAADALADADQPIASSGKIEVGSYSFNYEDLRRSNFGPFDRPGTRLIKVDEQGIELAIVELKIVSGPDAGMKLNIDSPIVVGAAPDCDLVLNDSCVSSRHIELFPTDADVQLRDLESKNGTFVNDVRVASAAVPPGAQIRLGNTLLAIQTRSEHIALELEPDHLFCGMAGRSESMRRLFALLKRLAPVDVPVLISGATGVGKELAARALHDLSPRCDGPFIAVNCAALSSQIFESELFGHVKGAFTDATKSRPGLLMATDGGTLFLDELGELPLDLQAKLLRVLESGEAIPVGSDTPVPVDVRIVAASNRNLAVEVENGTFRTDLYYRISVFPIHIPPLSTRPEDIELIANVLLADISRDKRLDEAALEMLRDLDWPGNVRQLRNVLSRAALLSESETIGTETIVQARQMAQGPGGAARENGLTLSEIEHEAIIATLARHGGNRTKAARALGIAKSTLYEKLRRYGIAENS